MNELWCIWSIEHNAWWKSSANGYTVNPREAGRYEFEYACSICRNANKFQPGNRPNETMVLASDINQNMK